MAAAKPKPTDGGIVLRPGKPSRQSIFMKLFQRIFLTFFFVIIAAIFVASFSFWLVQDRMAEIRLTQ